MTQAEMPAQDEPASDGLLTTIEKDAEAASDALGNELKVIEGEIKEAVSPKHYQEQVAVEKELPPQLKFETFPSQIFWLAVTFTIFYVLMSRSVIPRIRSVLEKRQTQINHDLDTAERAKHDAEKAKRAYEKDLLAARENATRMIQEAQALAASNAASETHALDQKLAKSIAEADARIGEQIDKARQGLRPVAAEVAGSIVQQILNTKADDKSLTAAVAAQMKG